MFVRAQPMCVMTGRVCWLGGCAAVQPVTRAQGGMRMKKALSNFEFEFRVRVGFGWFWFGRRSESKWKVCSCDGVTRFVWLVLLN